MGKVANTSMIADRVLADCVDADLVLVLIVVVGAMEPPAVPEVGDEGDEGIFTGAAETVDGAFVVELGVGAPVVPTLVGLVETVAAGALVAPRVVGAPVVPPTTVGAPPSIAPGMEGGVVSPLLLGDLEEDEAVPVNVGAVVSPLLLGDLEEDEAVPAPEGATVLPEIMGPPVEDDPDPDPDPAGVGDRVGEEPEAVPAPEGAAVLPEIMGPPVEDDPGPPVVGASVLEDEPDPAFDGDLVEEDEGVDIIEGVGAPGLDVEGVVAGDEVMDELGAVPDPEKVIFLIVL